MTGVTPPVAPTARGGRLRSGDGLRAVAMLSIFFLHAFLDARPDGRPDPRFDYWGPAGQFLARLDLGLSIFFVLSGYLIAGPFVRAYVSGQPLPSVFRFARNRLRRILPVYWVGVILVLLYFGTAGSSFAEVLGVFAFLDMYIGIDAAFPIAQGWTLATEMAFYASVPVMAAAFVIAARITTVRGRSPQARATLALVLLGLATALSLWQRSRAPSTMSALNNPLGVFYAFAPGVALAILEPVLSTWLRARPVRSMVLGVCLLAGAAAGVAAYVVLEPGYYVALHHVRAGQAAAAAGFAFCLLGGLLAMQLGADRCPRILESRPMVWMGERSYPFYVAHFGVLLAVIPLAGDGASRAESQRSCASSASR